jgi:hypothetical protein
VPEVDSAAGTVTKNKLPHFVLQRRIKENCTKLEEQRYADLYRVSRFRSCWECNIYRGADVGLSHTVVTANVVRFEGFTAVTVKNRVFWDVTPCGSCENRRFGGT